jgi:RimJ/RimL family protein N-acetyltransferase
MTLEGRYVRLAPLSHGAHHAALFEGFSGDDSLWDFMPYGPFASADAYGDWVARAQGRDDPLFLAVFDKDRRQWRGVASFMRIDAAMGVIEVGAITFAPALQRRRAATEAIFLMMQWVFEAGYRRFEWKCDAANLASRRAAARFGFSYEGIFRQALVIKGRNRDTAWFAAIDSEWPALRAAYQRWLAPENFDENGGQIMALSDLTRPILAARDPGAHHTTS